VIENKINRFDKIIKLRKMFNTFGNDPNDLFQGNKVRMREKDKIIELTNLSTIQLNPWGDELSKSPIYDEH
jgi:hypothetical protein